LCEVNAVRRFFCFYFRSKSRCSNVFNNKITFKRIPMTCVSCKVFDYQYRHIVLKKHFLLSGTCTYYIHMWSRDPGQAPFDKILIFVVVLLVVTEFKVRSFSRSTEIETGPNDLKESHVTQVTPLWPNLAFSDCTPWMQTAQQIWSL